MRRFIILGLVLLLLSLAVGCGIPQEQYNSVIAERDSAKSALASMTTERDNINVKLTAVTNERDAAKAEVASLQAKITTSQGEITKLQADVSEKQKALDTAKTQTETLKSDVASLCALLEKEVKAETMISGYWADSSRYAAKTLSLSEYTTKTAAFMGSIGGALDAVGNQELSKKWVDAFAAAGTNDQVGFMTNFATAMDSLMKLINEDITKLKSKVQ